MSIIKKNYEQISEINSLGIDYLIKSGHLKQEKENIIQTKKVEKTKLDIALLDIIVKQIGKKILPEKRKRIRAISVEHALCDVNTKEVLYAERKNPKFGIMEDVFKMDQKQTLAFDIKIDALEKEEVEMHTRPVPKADMPVLTEDEQEAFGDLIVVE